MDERDELHKTVLAEEAVSALNIQSEGFYIDATFGRGGHSRAILSELGVEGHLLALDRDPEAIEAAQQLATQDLRLVRRENAVWANGKCHRGAANSGQGEWCVV
jgi:16S rRNA (cytosine1402-N4)-methyltransferase